MSPPHLPRPTLFPYTTLFRSILHLEDHTQAQPGQRGGKHALRTYLEHQPPRPSPHQDAVEPVRTRHQDRKSTRLNSSHVKISYAVFCLKKKTHFKGNL